MDDTQEVHDLFRGAAEVSKCVSSLALVGELIAAAIALHGIFFQDTPISLWRPILAFGLAFLTWMLRQYATHVDGFSERCRRLSLRAFARGAVISPSRCSSLRSDAPFFAARIGRNLPANTLNDYYEPSTEVGEGRLRELYGHSSFYTWRLLRASAGLYALGSGLLFAVALFSLYQLAASDITTLPRKQALDALFSVVLTILGLRGLSVVVMSALGASDARRIADALIADQLPTGTQLDELTEAYDFERTRAPSAPTWVYQLFRQRLAEDWAHRRRALSGSAET